MNTIQTAVAEKIVNLGPSVESKVIDVMVDKELTRRSDALVSVIGKLEQEEKSFNKLRADAKTYDEKGAVISEYFTKARIDERQKSTKKITKMTAAINKALEKGDFSDVYNFASGKEPADNAGDTPAEGAEAA